MALNALERKNRGKWRRVFAIVASYFLLAALIIGANPFKGETVGPFDLLASYPGWNASGAPVEVRNAQRSDIVDSLIPDWLEARRLLRSGEFPLWNPLPAGGRASISDPTRGMVSPAFFAFAAAPDPAFGFYLATLFNLVIAGLGMHFLLSRRLSSVSSYFAGISYMMCGFFAGWLFWPHILTAIWIPWLLFFVHREAWRHAFFNVIAIAGVTALMFMGGFPFVVAIGLGCLLVLIAVVCISAVTESSPLGWKSLVPAAWILFSVACGLMLVAIPLFGLASMLSDADLSHRSGGSGLSFSEHGRLLLQPWAGRQPKVELSMYVGMLALPLAALGLLRSMLRPRMDLGVVAAVYLLVAMMLTFGWLPRSIGTHLPVLSNNPWSRTILLLDISLIMLAAMGLEVLYKRLGAGKLALAFAMVVVSLQGGDLLRQFRKFNGPTPADLFYSARPVVMALGKRLRPFEYASQDGGVMMISGTGTAVGIADWFAHAMRSRELHNMLDAMAENPFTSPTATMIRSGDYHWRRPVQDMAANCYLIHPATWQAAPVLLGMPDGPQAPTAIGPINAKPVSQPFDLPGKAEVGSVSLRMATYQQSGLGGEVILRLVLPGAEQVLATSTVKAEKILDNQRVSFEFQAPIRLLPGRYRLDIEYVPNGETRSLTIWSKAGTGAPAFEINGKPQASVIDYSIIGSEDGSLQQVASDGVVSISENKDCMKGAYWTQDLTDPLETANVDAVQITRYESANFAFRVSAQKPGFLVVPMNLLPGWNVFVNKLPQDVVFLAGVIPAVSLPGEVNDVEFVYRPPGWKRGAIISFIALLMLLAAGLLDYRKRKMFITQTNQRGNISG